MMMRTKLLFWLLGSENRDFLDDMMAVVCGTKKNYEIRREAPIVHVLMRRWLKEPK